MICLTINNKILIAPSGTGGMGTIATQEVSAAVADGKLDLLFYAAKGGRIAVFALEIIEVKDK